MKILFSVGELEKDFNANTKIVLQTAEKLVSYGHSCIICGVCSAFSVSEITSEGVHIKRLPAVSPVVKSSEKFESFVAVSQDRNSARGQFIKKHPFASVFQFARYTAFYRAKIEQPRYLKQVQRLIKKYAPDAVVCVTKPVNSLETVINSNITVPMFIWQLDPWGLHHLDNPGETADIIARETQAFAKAKHIFTTPVLLQQYIQHDAYKKFTGKITAVEFPNIREYTEVAGKSAVNFDSSYINLLFSGIVSDEYRSPQHLLASLSPLFDTGEKIRIYFMGTHNSAVLEKYREMYPDNIINVEKVNMDTAFATMNAADVLVNISNTVDNQVPSKIFDYFSMGKPVLNVQKIPDCPAQPYFDRYPLRFTLDERETSDLEKLKQFLYDSPNARLDYSQVEQIYSGATVETVASQLADVISADITKGDR